MKEGYYSDGKRYLLKSLLKLDRADTYLLNDIMSVRVSENGTLLTEILKQDEPNFFPNLASFYIKNKTNNKLYSLPFRPVEKKYDNYSVDFGIYDITWSACIFNTEFTLRLFLPKDDALMLWTLSAKNNSSRKSEFSIFTYFPFNMGNTLGITSGFEKNCNSLYSYGFPYYVKVDDYYKLKEKKKYAFLACDKKPEYYETSIEHFNKGFTERNPKALQKEHLENGKACGNTSAAGIMQFDISLAKGKSAQLNFINGAASDTGEIAHYHKKYLKNSGIKKEYAKTAKEWDTLLKEIKITTPDSDFNSFVNNWLVKQIYFNGKLNRMSRQACVRNFIQDSMGVVYFYPEIPRNNYLKVMEAEDLSGSMMHGIALYKGVELTGINTIHHRDMPVWWPIALLHYIQETGDTKILNETGAYRDDKNTIETLYKHVCRGLDYLLKDRSERGLSFIGEGDWNDPLNMAGHKGKGESVWLTQALAYALDVWAQASDILNDNSTAGRYRGSAQKLRDIINQFAWDGKWYLRGTNDNGIPFGSSENKEGKIFINSQSWSIICGAAQEKKCEQQVIESMEKFLFTECGLPVTVSPPFTYMHEDIGKLTLKTPGTSENGSMYSHACMFYAYSLYKIGKNDKAWKVLRNLLTGSDENPIEKSGQLPLYIPNFYTGPFEPRLVGKSSHNAGTGTVAWYLCAIITELFGLKPELNGFKIEPKLPTAWQNAEIDKKFRGARFLINIRKVKDIEKIRVRLNNKNIPNTFIPLMPKGSFNKVIVEIPD